MSKPNNEKYIIVFNKFCSLMGQKFNWKISVQRKDTVYTSLFSNFYADKDKKLIANNKNYKKKFVSYT